MIALSECLEQARGKSPEEFVQHHPHPVIIGLGVLPGELQRNPAKASGTLFLSVSPEQASASAPESSDKLVNQVFEIRKSASHGDLSRIEVGWSPQNDVDIPDHTVSRSHAHFVLQAGGGVVLVDGGSTNGTFVNGTRLEANRSVEVKPGDILTFGRYSFTYYDALSFAKLLWVQAMMRPRSSGRKPMAPPGGTRLGPGAAAPVAAPRSAVPSGAPAAVAAPRPAAPANISAPAPVSSPSQARPVAAPQTAPSRQPGPATRPAGADPFQRSQAPRSESGPSTPWPPPSAAPGSQTGGGARSNPFAATAGLPRHLPLDEPEPDALATTLGGPRALAPSPQARPAGPPPSWNSPPSSQPGQSAPSAGGWPSGANSGFRQVSQQDAATVRLNVPGHIQSMPLSGPPLAPLPPVGQFNTVEVPTHPVPMAPPAMSTPVSHPGIPQQVVSQQQMVSSPLPPAPGSYLPQTGAAPIRPGLISRFVSWLRSLFKR